MTFKYLADAQAYARREANTYRSTFYVEQHGQGDYYVTAQPKQPDHQNVWGIFRYTSQEGKE